MDIEKEQIRMKSLVEQINEEFDHIAEIYVAHLPTASALTKLHITVHTGEAESFEQYPNITSADEVTINEDNAEILSVPFSVMATFDGPGHMHASEGTTVYMADNVLGAEPRELEDGISILRQKLTGVCPSCGDNVESFNSHYNGNHSCRRAEHL